MTVQLFVAIASVLFLLGGMAIYMPWRLGGIFGLSKTRYLYAASLLLIISGYSSVSMVSAFSSELIDQFYLISTGLLGFAFFLFVFLLLFDAINLLIKLPKKIFGPSVVALALLVTVYGIWNAYRFEVREVDVAVSNLDRPVGIAVLADIQMGGHRGKSYLQQVVEAINALQPDLVVIPGDLADSNTILTEDNFSPLAQLHAPTFFVTGNHDTYVDEQKLVRIISDLGVRVLENEAVEIQGFQLIGLKYMNADEDVFDLHPSDDKQTIKRLLPTLKIATDRPSILIHHSAVGLPYVHEAGVDLYIAGHTHAGGQVFPATLIGCGFFFTYCRGFYDYKDTKIFVSPGVGTFILPMRVGTNNEITLLRLRGE